MRITTYATALGVALMGTLALAQSVNYDYDRAVNFSKFRTYAWVRGTNLSDELNHKRVVHAVDSQLALKGLNRVESEGAADLLVAYHANFDQHLQVNGMSTGFGGPRFGNASGIATAQRITSGALVVDMLDAATRAIVWRGTAERDLDPAASPKNREKNITKAAEKIFKNYPPKP